MTIGNQTVKTDVVCDGVSFIHNYDFLVPEDGSTALYLTDPSDGTQTEIAANAYTVANEGNPSGGTFTYPLSGDAITASWILTLIRTTPYTQTANLNNQGAYYPEAVEGGMDWLAQQTQQLEEKAGRSLKVPVSEDPIGDLPALEARKGMLLGFNAITGEPEASPPGQPGTPGTAGASFLSGLGAPSDTLGNNNDSYVDVDPNGDGTTYDKSGGVWVDNGGSLKGPPGETTVTGGVVGPASSTIGNIAVWNDSLGGSLEDGGALGALAFLDEVTVAEIDNAPLEAMGGLSGGGIVVMPTASTAAVRSIAAVSPLSIANGDGVSGNPTITTSVSSGILLGRGSASTGAVEQIAIGSGLTLTGTTLSNTSSAGGYEGQIQTTTYATQNTISATFPYDSSAPQNSEGTQIMTLDFTPNNASSRLFIQAVVNVSATCTIGEFDTGSVGCIVALFVDSTASALQSVSGCRVNLNGQLAEQTLVLNYETSAASTTLRTYKIRVGKATVNTVGSSSMTVNPINTLGGTKVCRLTVTEIPPET